MRAAVWLTALIAIAGAAIGIGLTSQFFIRFDQGSFSDLNQRIQGLVQLWPVGQIMPVLAIFWQNSRVLLMTLVLGMFSLGILGVLPLMVSMAVVGYLYGLLTANGFSPLMYAGLLLPHAIIEIPAAIISTAAVLWAGALLATPNTEKTVGEVWLITMAHWFKIMLGLVLPLLFIAAGIEAWVTPRLAVYFVH
jgi:uncharacterized membrane protein SpoIIM required for sporulation